MNSAVDKKRVTRSRGKEFRQRRRINKAWSNKINQEQQKGNQVIYIFLD